MSLTGSSAIFSMYPLIKKKRLEVLEEHRSFLLRLKIFVNYLMNWG